MTCDEAFDADPTKVDHGVGTGPTNVNNIMASRYIGDYQPSQALKCLMQAPPPPSSPETRLGYLRHVIKYSDSHHVGATNNMVAE